MKRAWYTIDRWGPGAVAVLTLLAVAILAWSYDRQLANRTATINGLQNQINILNSQLVSRDNLNLALRNEVQTWQAYVVSLHSAIIKSGLKVDDPPKPRIQITKSDKPTRNK